MTILKAVLITLVCVLLWGSSGTPARAHHLTTIEEFEDCVLEALQQFEECLAGAQTEAEGHTCFSQYMEAHGQCVGHCAVCHTHLNL